MKLGYNFLEKPSAAALTFINKYIESDSANIHFLFKQKDRGKKIEFKRYYSNNSSIDYPLACSLIQKEILLPLAMIDSGIDIFISPYHLMPIRQPSKTLSLILDVREFLLSRNDKGLKHSISVFIKNKALKKTNRIITSSLASKNYLAKKLGIDPGRIYKLYLPPQEEFAPIFDERKCIDVKNKYGIGSAYFICAGDFNCDKSIIELFEYFKIFSTLNNGIELVIAHKRNTDLTALAGKFRSSQHKINCLHISSTHELSALYNGALAFISTAGDDAFPCELLEAIFCGIPVISYKNQFSLEILEDAGILIGRNETSFFTKAMKRLYDDRNSHLKWRAKSLERSRFFSSSRPFLKFNSLLNEIFEEKYKPDEK